MVLRKLIFYWKTANVYLHYHRKKYIPFLVIIDPISTCNLKCKYCNRWNSNENHQIPLSKLYDLVDQIHDLGIPYISFSGGEPLLVKDIEAVGAYARSKHIYVNLNTNGTLINEKRATGIARSFDFIRVSLDGIGEDHDSLAGVPGTYDKVSKAIELLASVHKKAAKIGINYVLDASNMNKSGKIVKKFKDKVDFISYLPQFRFEQKCNYEIVSPNKRIMKFQSTLERHNQSGNTKEFLKNPNLEYSREICDAGKLYIQIGADGWVSACPFVTKENDMDAILGSIYENKLDSIIGRKSNLAFSDKCYGCHATCTTEVSRIFRMRPTKLLKKFFYLKKTFKH